MTSSETDTLVYGLIRVWIRVVSAALSVVDDDSLKLVPHLVEQHGNIIQIDLIWVACRLSRYSL